MTSGVGRFSIEIDQAAKLLLWQCGIRAALQSLDDGRWKMIKAADL